MSGNDPDRKLCACKAQGNAHRKPEQPTLDEIWHEVVFRVRDSGAIELNSPDCETIEEWAGMAGQMQSYCATLLSMLGAKDSGFLSEEEEIELENILSHGINEDNTDIGAYSTLIDIAKYQMAELEQARERIRLMRGQ